MRINSIDNSYQIKSTYGMKRTNRVDLHNRCNKLNDNMTQPSFQGKHECAKFFGGLFGVMGTLGAIGGTIVISGGVALPMVLGYGALSAGSGFVIGHLIDKGSKNVLPPENYDRKE